MLAWVSRRAASAGQATVPNKPASALNTTSSLPSRPAFCSTRNHSKSITASSYSSFQVRNYAKIVKTVKKVPKPVAKKAEPKLVFDEDIEEDPSLAANDLELEDATHLERKDPEYLQSAVQMEDILRNSLPPELVEQAIAEHRRTFSAYKSGKLTQTGAKQSGFARRLSPAELKAQVDSLSASSPVKSPLSASTPSSTTSQVQGVAHSVSSPASKAVSTSTKAAPSKSKTEEEDDMEEYEDDDDYDNDESPLSATSKKKETLSTKAKRVKRRAALERAKREGKLIAAINKQQQYDREQEQMDDEQFEMNSGEDFDMEAREERLKEKMARADRRANPENEDLLHHRMARLRGIIKGTDDGSDDPTARKIVERANIELKERASRRKVKISPEDVSQLAREARDYTLKGMWNKAFETYQALSDKTNNSTFLSNFAFDAWREKQPDIAGQAAIAAYNIDENDVKANMIAARALLAQHDAERPDASTRLSVALQHVDRALERHSDSPDLLSIKGSIYSAMRKFKTATSFFKAALLEFDTQKFPRTSRVITYRDFGKALAGRGRYKVAKKYLEMAHQIAPKDVEIISLIAELYERGFNDVEGAAPFYRLAVQTEPEDVPSLVRLGQLFSDPSYSGQDFAQARQCYERAMMLRPLPDFWFPLGWLSMQLGENEKAITCLQKAAETDTTANNRWTALILMAEIYAFDPAPGAIERAIQLYKFALEERAEPSLQLNLAKCLLRVGAADEAEVLVEQIRGSDPNNCELKCILVEVYYMVGRKELAHQELDNVIAEHPLELTPQFMKGKYLYEDGNYEDALPFLQRSIETTMDASQSGNLAQFAELMKDISKKFETDNPSKAASIKKNLANKNTKVSEREYEDGQAEEDEDESLGSSMAPEYAQEALYLLSRCHFEAEDWNEAKRVTIHALKLDPENSQLLQALGEAHLRLQEFVEAAEVLRKASVLDRSAVRPSFRLGNLYAERESPDQALPYYQRALDAAEALIERNKEQKRDGGDLDSLAGVGEGFSAQSAKAAASSAVPRNEQISDSELHEMLYAIHSNMSECYKQLASQDRANYAKFSKSAATSAQRALELRAARPE